MSVPGKMADPRKSCSDLSGPLLSDIPPSGQSRSLISERPAFSQLLLIFCECVIALNERARDNICLWAAYLPFNGLQIASWGGLHVMLRQFFSTPCISTIQALKTVILSAWAAHRVCAPSPCSPCPQPESPTAMGAVLQAREEKC